MKLKVITFLLVVITASALFLFGKYSTGEAEQALSNNTPAGQSIVHESNLNADTGISSTKALEIILAAFPDLNLEGGKINSFLVETPNRHWSITLKPQGENDYSNACGFTASVVADTGEILSFRRIGKLEVSNAKVVTKQEARQIAEDLARRLLPEKFQNTEYINPSPNLLLNKELIDRYQFGWARTVNGITVENQGIEITVDALSGNIIEFGCQWQADLVLTETTGVISAEELSQKLMREVGLVLNYDRYPDSSAQNSRALLAYRINCTDPIIMDASTGNFLDSKGQTLNLKDLKEYGDIPAAPDGNKSGIITEPAAAGPFTDLEKARKIFRALGYAGEVAQMKDELVGPTGPGESYIYYIRDESGSPSNSNFLRIRNDPSTGISINLNNIDKNPQEGQPVSREEALKKAWQFIRQAEPELAGHLVLAKELPLKFVIRRGHSFNFHRIENGIPVQFNGISLELDEDGSINNYIRGWYHTTFPSSDIKVSSEEAARIWLKNNPFKLKYVLRSVDTPFIKGSKYLLVYTTENPRLNLYIDAYTGEVFFSDHGVTMRPGNAPRYDFADSWAVSQLDLLANSEMLPAPGQFSPSFTVTRREGLRLLIATKKSELVGVSSFWMNPFQDIKIDDPDYRIIQYAASEGIIEKEENFRPDDVLTRADLAAWMVNFMGHKDVTMMTNKVTSSFQDLDPLSLMMQNYIGAANEFGLMSGDGSGNFRPTDGVTWEELSTAVLKLLANQREPLSPW